MKKRNCYIAVALLILLAYGIVAPLARGEDGSATYERSRKLYYGADGERYDRAKAVELLVTARKSGSLAAQALLANYYFNRDSWYKESDYAEARRLAKDPSERGFSIANYVMGEALKKGRGCDQDEKLASDYYRKAFEGFQKDASTFFLLGILFDIGRVNGRIQQ